jgi:hypothetical protein
MRHQALDSVVGVTVAYDTGVAACATAGTVISITFTNDPGDLDPGFVTSSLTGGTTATLSMRTIQTLTCSCTGTCSGSITLKLDGHETAAVANDAVIADLDAALEVSV